ncbi:hypothetical protein HRI_000581700 [Hibiscus trionum]|uniref:Uncharacterized protein n=1 Tax=Hibiscus trionum TaxID=183268 RepID=A0A9W7LLU1_HIBTR|nr:hypothetical protein HRI_000581700 [Hibiscus trionum]
MGSISKSFLILALLAAVVLLVSWDVAARDLAETTTEKINKGEVATEKAKPKVGEAEYVDYGGYPDPNTYPVCFSPPC